MIWLSVNSFSARAADHLIMADNFEWFGLDQWRETFNGQLDNSSLPCRSQFSDRETWQIFENQAQLFINGSVPCKVVIQPAWLVDLPSEPLFTDHFKTKFTFTPLWTLADYNWLILWEDENNYLGFHQFDRAFYVEKVINGKSYPIQPSSGNYYFKSYQPYEIAIEYRRDLGEIKLTINNSTSYFFTELPNDPKLLTGVPGLAGSVGAARNISKVSYDNWQLWEADSEAAVSLAVPEFSQVDPIWTKIEYDSANTWSPENPTIGRWGCALTSAAMVFRYFGLDKLPDGQLLTPVSLNTWLNSQTDGYVDFGWLNWRALTRLSQQIKDTWQTSALEFTFENRPAEHLEWLQIQLWRNVPVILAQPDHFVVANGFNSALNTGIIIDPANIHNSLLDFNNTWLSARLFTPSNTDLSAITLWTDPGVFVKQDQSLLQPFVDDYEFYPAWIYDWPKPAEGNFELNLANYDLSPRQIKLFVYQHNGNVQQLDWTLPGQTNDFPLAINFSKASESVISRPLAEFDLISHVELVSLLSDNQLASPWLIDWFLEQVGIIKTSVDLLSAQAYLFQAINELENYQSNGWLTPSAQLLLTDNLTELVQDEWP